MRNIVGALVILSDFIFHRSRVGEFKSTGFALLYAEIFSAYYIIFAAEKIFKLVVFTNGAMDKGFQINYIKVQILV